jgi:hypothetical protein
MFKACMRVLYKLPVFATLMQPVGQQLPLLGPQPMWQYTGAWRLQVGKHACCLWQVAGLWKPARHASSLLGS